GRRGGRVGGEILWGHQLPGGAGGLPQFRLRCESRRASPIRSQAKVAGEPPIERACRKHRLGYQQRSREPLAKFPELENSRGHRSRCNHADVMTGVAEMATDLRQREGRQGWARGGRGRGIFLMSGAFDPSWTVPSSQRRSMGCRWRGSERSDYDQNARRTLAFRPGVQSAADEVGFPVLLFYAAPST